MRRAICKYEIGRPGIAASSADLSHDGASAGFSANTRHLETPALAKMSPVLLPHSRAGKSAPDFTPAISPNASDGGARRDDFSISSRALRFMRDDD